MQGSAIVPRPNDFRIVRAEQTSPLPISELLIVVLWEARPGELRVVCPQPPIVQGAQSGGRRAIRASRSARLPQPWTSCVNPRVR